MAQSNCCTKGGLVSGRGTKGAGGVKKQWSHFIECLKLLPFSLFLLSLCQVGLFIKQNVYGMICLFLVISLNDIPGFLCLVVANKIDYFPANNNP